MATAMVTADYPPNADPSVEKAQFAEHVQHLAQGLIDRGYENIAIEINGQEATVEHSDPIREFRQPAPNPPTATDEDDDEPTRGDRASKK